MADQLPQQSIRQLLHRHQATSGDRRKLDPCGGVGLAIVVALDKTAGAESTPPPTTIVTGRGHRQCQETSNLYSGSTFTAESPTAMIGGAFEGFQVAEFLSRCYLCKKWLHGKDIYMYRGEKGFCSTECRYQQMIIDENQEIYGSETTKSTEMPSTLFAAGEIFFPGLVVS